jgi:hypothetical protein
MDAAQDAQGSGDVGQEAGIDCQNNDAPELLDYLRGIPDAETRWKKTKVVLRNLQEYAEQADDRIGAVYIWLKSDQCWRTSFPTEESLDEEFPAPKSRMDQQISRTQKYVSAVEKYWKDEPARTWCKANTHLARRAWESIAKFAADHPYNDFPNAANYALMARLTGSTHRQGKPIRPVLSTCDFVSMLSQQTPTEFPFREEDLAKHGLCVAENGFLSKVQRAFGPDKQAAQPLSHLQDLSKHLSQDLRDPADVGLHLLQTTQKSTVNQLDVGGQDRVTEPSTDLTLSNALSPEEPTITGDEVTQGLPSSSSLVRTEEATNSQAEEATNSGTEEATNSQTAEPMLHEGHDVPENPNLKGKESLIRRSERLARVKKPEPAPVEDNNYVRGNCGAAL